MLSPQVKQVVEKSAPSEVISFLVSLDLDEEVRTIRECPDVTTRRSLLAALYHREKQPLLDTVSRYRRGGMKVISELEGSPDLILSGPAHTWRQIFSGSEPALIDPKVDFTANEMSWEAYD